MKKLIKYLSVVGISLILVIFLKNDINITDLDTLFRIRVVLFIVLLMVVIDIITEDLKY